MTEFTWFLAQWAFFVAVVCALAWRIWRDSEQLSEMHREARMADERLWEACLHLRAARRRGLPLNPYMDRVVDRTLSVCNRSATGEHEPDERNVCRACRMGLGD